jgi:hypothetical protein
MHPTSKKKSPRKRKPRKNTLPEPVVEATIVPTPEEPLHRCPQGHEQRGACAQRLRYRGQLVADSGPVCMTCITLSYGAQFPTTLVEVPVEPEAPAPVAEGL